MQPHFLGLGAQRSGTSWIYSCLNDHPEICIPIKEIHFFSRERNYPKGIEWYERIFDRCPPGTKAGEFSTSYLYDKKTPSRIAKYYPKVKLIASLRNPIDRAYSNYRNDIMAGNIPDSVSFEGALENHPEYLEQGLYTQQLKRYLKYFNRNQMLILIYDDLCNNSAGFIKDVYDFLGVNADFSPSMLDRRINVARTPRVFWLSKFTGWIKKFMQKAHMENLLWTLRKIRVPDLIHYLNTKQTEQANGLSLALKATLGRYFLDDTKRLSELLGRNLVNEWNLELKDEL